MMVMPQVQRFIYRCNYEKYTTGNCLDDATALYVFGEWNNSYKRKHIRKW